MRVLHLTPELPYEPGGGGGRTREFYMCRRLVELGHEVLNVSPMIPAEVAKVSALEAIGVEVRGTRRPASAVREVARAVASEPQILWTALRDPERALEMRVIWHGLRPVAQSAAEQWRPDVLLLGHDMAMDWARDLPANLPAVLTCHNLLWNWYESRARRSHPPVSWLLSAEAVRYERFVKRRLGRFHTAVAVSTAERDQLERIGGPDVELIPTGVDVDGLRPAPEQDGPPRVIFTGTLSYPPNDEGGRWLVERVWPLVRARMPDARLDIVGKDPTRELQDLGGSAGVTVVGPVESMQPYFDAAHVVAVPILTGAGIRVKIVEAISAGRPVVSTPLGCEGLGLEDGHHLLVAGEAEPFADALVQLLSDPVRRATLAYEGRRRAEQEFDQRMLGDRLAHVLERAVAARPAA